MYYNFSDDIPILFNVIIPGTIKYGYNSKCDTCRVYTNLIRIALRSDSGSLIMVFCTLISTL